jgi:HD-like signal output (HDOD) protein
VTDSRSRDDAFTAGLLHDIGMLALAVGVNKRYALALRHAERSRRPLADVETSFIGTSHVAVGAYLAGVWGLPDVVVEAIELHHDDAEPSEPHADVVRAVRLAQACAECLEHGDHRFRDVELTAEQRSRIDREFSLADAMPRNKEPLLAI